MALEERRITEYPPFSYIALLRAEAVEQQEALKFLDAMSRQARSLIALNPQMQQVILSEPVPSAMEKRAGRYRAQLLVQAPTRKPLHVFLNSWRSSIETTRQSRKVRWSLDIDPIDLY